MSARVVSAMVEELDERNVVALERVLALLLQVPGRPAARRAGELGFLAGMLDRAETEFTATADPGEHFVARVAQRDYDSTRPAGTRSGRALTRKYGSWARACLSARGLAGDGDGAAGDGSGTQDGGRGRTEGAAAAAAEAADRSEAWTTNTERHQKAPPYSRPEVIAALRACAAALNRPVSELTSNRYYDWVQAQRRWARDRGMPPPRLATQRSVGRYWHSWRDARTAAGADRGAC